MPASVAMKLEYGPVQRISPEATNAATNAASGSYTRPSPRTRSAPDSMMPVKMPSSPPTDISASPPPRKRAMPAEPRPKPVELRANAPYPEGAPLSMVPPDLLAKLPKLPEPLEYRFVGGHLILLDSEASLVVDFLKETVA